MTWTSMVTAQPVESCFGQLPCAGAQNPSVNQLSYCMASRRSARSGDEEHFHAGIALQHTWYTHVPSGWAVDDSRDQRRFNTLGEQAQLDAPPSRRLL